MKKILLIMVALTLTVSTTCAVDRYIMAIQDGTAVSLSRQFLKGQMGLKESGYNRGLFIRNYAMSVWGKPLENYFYCMAGQVYVLDSACKILNIPFPLLRTAHCLTQSNWCRTNALAIEKVLFPKIDDIIIWGTGSSGHTGRVVEVLDKTKWIVRTGEMNTTVTGVKGDERNGSGNSFKKRYLKTPLNKMKLKSLINFKQR